MHGSPSSLVVAGAVAKVGRIKSPCKSTIDGASLNNNIDELRVEVDYIKKDIRPRDLSDPLNHSDLGARVEALEINYRIESIRNLISDPQLRSNTLEERSYQAVQKARIGKP